MIKTFADKATERLFCGGECDKLPPEIRRRALRKLDMLDAAYVVEDLRMPPGNRLHLLTGSRLGQHAIAVNAQWRICFRFEDGCAYDVELCNYH